MEIGDIRGGLQRVIWLVAGISESFTQIRKESIERGNGKLGEYQHYLSAKKYWSMEERTVSSIKSDAGENEDLLRMKGLDNRTPQIP